jgi:hypothetical protein
MMGDYEMLLHDVQTQIFTCGQDYDEKDRLTHAELDDLCRRANEQLCTMNGDAGTIQITVRQFALLLFGAWSGESCQAPQQPAAERATDGAEESQ